ncbi:MAG: PQQ-dependent dehydrogenase, methanol/ethanol family [Pseudomonadales bacterium]
MHALSTRRRLAGCLAMIVLLTGGCSQEATRSAEPSENAPATGSVEVPPATPRVTNTERIAANAEPDQWLSHGGNYAEQRFAKLEHINDSNVGRLGLAWYFDFDTHRGQESTPLMVDGRLYVSSAWSKVFALDAATGQELWRFDPQVPGKAGINACCDVVNRGVAFYQGKVFVGTIDGRLIALNADTGAPVWSTMTVDPTKPYTITGAPRAAKGKVFIGNGGAEYGVRGYVSAYDVDTGALAWRFYTTPSDPQLPPDGAASDKILKELAAPPWHGRSWLDYGGGGGTVWDAIVYDPELDQLYIGTGNGSPWNRHIRSEGKGDNLFLSSVVALDPDTGAYRWHYQETPGETWDYTATQPIILATLAVAGEQRPVLMHAPKNGFFYVLDRRDGKLLSAEKFVPANWAERIDLETGRPVETADARFTDRPFLSTVGGAGAHNWQPMSYSPQTGLVYIPAQQIAFVYSQEEKFAYRPGEWNLGVNLTQDPLPTDAEARSAIKQGLQGRLLAWDPVRQQEAWRIEHGAPWNGGTLATAGNLVFQGLSDRTFQAFRAQDGQPLWSFPTQNAILTAPISYAVNDEQFVVVTAGNGGGLPLTLPSFAGPQAEPNGRVLAFKLDGKAQLPVFEPQPRAIVAAKVDISEQQLAEGFSLFGRHCAACHGIELLSAGVLPDLRTSPALADPAGWRGIILGGALEARGMVGFSDRLDAREAEILRGYVANEANRLATISP